MGSTGCLHREADLDLGQLDSNGRPYLGFYTRVDPEIRNLARVILNQVLKSAPLIPYHTPADFDQICQLK